MASSRHARSKRQHDVLAVCHVEDARLANLDSVWQVKLARACSEASPLAQLSAVGRVFQNAGIAIAVRYKDMPIRPKSKVSYSPKGAASPGNGRIVMVSNVLPSDEYFMTREAPASTAQTSP